MKSGVTKTLCALFLCCTVGNIRAFSDCEIVQSANLTIDENDTENIEISYLETDLVFLLYHTAGISVEKRGNGISVWKGEDSSSLCRAYFATLITDTMRAQDMNLIKNIEEGILLDLRLIKTKEDIYCQVPIPDSGTMSKSTCEGILEDIAQLTSLPPQTIDSLNLKPGLNSLYVTKNDITIKKPNKILCKTFDSKIIQLNENLISTMNKITTKLTLLDKSFKTTFISHIETILTKCHNDDIQNIYDDKLDRDVSRKCLENELKELAKRKAGIREKRSIRKKRMSLITLGGDGGDDTKMLNEINSNFDQLTSNEKKIFKKLLNLQMEKDLEILVLETEHESLRKLENNVQGLQQIRNLEEHDQSIIQYKETAMLRTLEILNKFQQRLDDLIFQTSRSLEGQLVCRSLRCHKPEDIHLLKTAQGLGLFLKGRRLEAVEGVSPSCKMDVKERISIYHLQHMKEVNDTYFESEDGEIVEKKCLLDYTKCSSTLLRFIDHEDLIDGNILISPARKTGVLIQCLQPENIQTVSGFITCDKKRKGASLPLHLASGKTIGNELIKHGSAFSNPVNFMSDDYQGRVVGTKSLAKIKAMKKLGQEVWTQLKDTSKVNSHHASFSVGLAVATALGVIGCLLQCCIHCWRSGGNPFSDLRCGTRERWDRFKTRLPVWRRQPGEGAIPPPEVLEQTYGTQPTAHFKVGEQVNNPPILLAGKESNTSPAASSLGGGTAQTESRVYLDLSKLLSK